MSFKDRYGPWAIVAGASEGTGAAFSRQVAEKGLNLILIARREGSLEDVPPGCTPPGTPREWTQELARARSTLDAFGPINARAETDHAEELAALQAQQAELNDAQGAADELRTHLAELETAETSATRAANTRSWRAAQSPQPAR